MLSILRDSPLDAFRPGSLEEGIKAHRWGKFVTPPGKTVDDMPRGAQGRLIGEVPGDGNVFDHQLAQERLVRQYGVLDVGSEAVLRAGYVRLRPVSFADYSAVRVTALVHDLGEIDHGDTIHDDKHLSAHTVRDEIESTRKFVRKALDERLSRPTNKGREDLRRKRRMERNVMSAYSIDHDKGHRLHGLFKLYEKYSYFSGAIAIYGEGRGTIAQSVAAVHNVLKNQTVPLVAAALAGVPSAKEFLHDRVEAVTAMFAWVSGSGFRDEENPENDERFERAKKAWGEYLRIEPVCHRSVKFGSRGQ